MDSGVKLQERMQEIDTIAKYLSSRADSYLKEGKHLIIQGDFNIISREHETMKKLENNGFFMPPEIGFSNKLKNKAYDQIAFKKLKGEIDYERAGVVDIFKWVHRKKDWQDYLDEMKKSSNELDFMQILQQR